MDIFIYIIAGILAVAFLFLVGFRRVPQGRAMANGNHDAFFQYYWQLPGTKRYGGVDLTLKKIAAECRDAKALKCADGIKIELRVVALIRVRPDKESVRQTLLNYGSGSEAGNKMQEELEDALEKAVRETGDKIPSLALVEHEQEFKQQVANRLGLERTGFQMDSLALEFVDPELLTKTKFGMQ